MTFGFLASAVTSGTPGYQLTAHLYHSKRSPYHPDLPPRSGFVVNSHLHFLATQLFPLCVSLEVLATQTGRYLALSAEANFWTKPDAAQTKSSVTRSSLSMTTSTDILMRDAITTGINSWSRLPGLFCHRPRPGTFHQEALRDQNKRLS